MTFPDPQVQQALAAIAVARVDIDAAANREVVQRHHDGDGVPAFVLLSENGAVLQRWGGAEEPAAFLAHLRDARDHHAAAAAGALGQHAALAEFYAARNEPGAAEAQRAALERLDTARTSPELARASWACCSVAKERRDWDTLHTAVRRHLALPNAPHAETAGLWLGIAEFERSGSMTPELQSYVDQRIGVLLTQPPGRTVADRVSRLLGQANPRAGGTVREWVARVNTAADELVAVGRAAGASLRAAIIARPGAMRPAVALGRLRLPDTTLWLAERLDDARTPAWARPHLVLCLRMHKEERDLPLLLRCLAADRQPAERAEAARGIRELAFLAGGTTREDVADALMSALESAHTGLRGEVLQALFYVHVPLPLDDLLDLLSDRRELGWDDVRVCDNALWIVLLQLGMNVQRSDGAEALEQCTPELAAWLRQWHAGVRERLHWDAAARHYRVTP